MRKMLLAAVALAVAVAASAQEPKFDFKRDTTRTSGFALPDSLAHMSPWKPDYKTMAPVKTKPTVSMTVMREGRFSFWITTTEVIDTVGLVLTGAIVL